MIEADCPIAARGQSRIVVPDVDGGAPPSTAHATTTQLGVGVRFVQKVATSRATPAGQSRPSSSVALRSPVKSRRRYARWAAMATLLRGRHDSRVKAR